MDIIRSRQNSTIKWVAQLLQSSRERRKQGVTVLEGVHLAQAYLQAGCMPEWVLMSHSALADAEIRALAEDCAIGRTLVVDDRLFEQLSELKTAAGVMLVISTPKPTLKSGEFCLLLEDIQDPGNVGSILRSAAGAGVGDVYLSKHCADAWSPKVLRAGMGAHFALSIREEADLLSVAAAWHGQLIATSLEGQRYLYDLDLSGPVALIFGNEGAGVSSVLLKAASERVRIPMPGKVESLNVAAAAAICLFEKVRQGGVSEKAG